MFTTGWAAPRRRSACQTADVLSHDLDATTFWSAPPTSTNSLAALAFSVDPGCLRKGWGIMGFLKNNPVQSSRAYPILSDVNTARCCPARAAAPETAAQCLQAIARAPAKDVASDAPRPRTPTAATSSARVPSVSDDDAQNWRCRWGRVAEIWGADQKVVASRLCALRASTSAVRQTDRLRGAAHPVVNIRTSEHHILSRPLLSVRMFGSWGKKRADASSNCAAL